MTSADAWSPCTVNALCSTSSSSTCHTTSTLAFRSTICLERSDHIAASYPGTVKTSRWSIGQYLGATHVCKLHDFEAESLAAKRCGGKGVTLDSSGAAL